MDNKKYRIFLIIIGVLVTISVAMVAFQYYVINTEVVEYKQYYRATKDIPSFTKLSADMFESVTVEKNTKLKGMVDNLTAITGKYSSKALSKGEYLTDENIKDTADEKGLVYTIEINASFIADVAYDDVVDIYSLNQDNSITLMFGKKKIYKPKTSAIADPKTDEAGQPQAPGYEAASKMYIKVTKEEMMRYYTSLRDCKLIILPYDEKNSDDYISNLATEVEQNSNENTSDVIDTFDYIVQEGDTFEILEGNFEVSTDDIKKANPSLTTLVPGETIKMPTLG